MVSILPLKKNTIIQLFLTQLLTQSAILALACLLGTNIVPFFHLNVFGKQSVF